MMHRWTNRGFLEKRHIMSNYEHEDRVEFVGYRWRCKQCRRTRYTRTRVPPKGHSQKKGRK